MSPAEPPSIVFFGTPQFAVPALEALASETRFKVIGVVTQPDKPAGRGEHLTPPPVKEAAEKLGIPVFQPASIKAIELAREGADTELSGAKSAAPLVEFLNTQRPDIFVCVAYGKIIPSSLLQFTPHGMVNIHPSLLPRWRGAAPIQHALFAGDERTGVALMEVDEGLDSGAVFAVEEVAIGPEETFGELHDRLAAIGARMLITLLPEILSGALRAQPQGEDGVTYAEKWERGDCRINWEDPAAVTLLRIRTCSPAPGAFFNYKGQPVKVFAAAAMRPEGLPEAAAGTVVHVTPGELIVAAGAGEYISLRELQFPGKKRLSISEILRGRAIQQGERFE